MSNLHNKIGCPILDGAKVGIGKKWERPTLCLDCPYPECVVKDDDNDLKEKAKPRKSREIYLRCKKCGATETLTITNGQLQKTPRWLQQGDIIYHTRLCGFAEELREG